MASNLLAKCLQPTSNNGLQLSAEVLFLFLQSGIIHLGRGLSKKTGQCSVEMIFFWRVGRRARFWYLAVAARKTPIRDKSHGGVALSNIDNSSKSQCLSVNLTPNKSQNQMFP